VEVSALQKKKTEETSDNDPLQLASLKTLLASLEDRVLKKVPERMTKEKRQQIM
jgi:hypothetical protein